MKDEELLSDYVDGRLAPAANAAFEARLKAEPALARRARALKALKGALSRSAPPMPADLKAALKREARAADSRRRRSPWLDSLRAALAAPWAYGAGAAAFAAVGVMFALHYEARRNAIVPGQIGDGIRNQDYHDLDAAEGLRGVWSEDNGSDNDEG